MLAGFILASPGWALHKYEPADGLILHGAGQDTVDGQPTNEFQTYSSYMPAAHKPVLQSWYASVGQSDFTSTYYANSVTMLGRVPQYTVPLIGLSMSTSTAGTSGGGVDGWVAQGRFDANLHDLASYCKRLQRPIYLRIGYEFNGSWNGYTPATFIQAWRHIVTLLRGDGVTNVAYVWDFAPNGDADYMDYYPGDAYVDWWGFNPFTTDGATGTLATNFLSDAAVHQMPVMICESDPTGTAVGQGQLSWNAWFAAFFQTIDAHPQIKAVVYINEDWRRYAPLAYWGDAQLQDDPVVLGLWIQQISRPRWISSQSQDQVLAAINGSSATVLSPVNPVPPILVSPNPWRADRNGGQPITFSHLGNNATVKLFTLSGHLMRTLSAPNGSAQWLPTQGDAASGIYLYLATDPVGGKRHGKFAIIR